ncbi:MAG: hypothetical protein ABSA44_11530 [Bacteroidota bacterium]|jgi:hypothetical protein
MGHTGSLVFALSRNSINSKEIIMHKSLTRRLEAQSQKGKKVFFKSKRNDNIELVGEVVDEVYVIFVDYKHMIQKIRFAEGQSWDAKSKFFYRFGYYTYDKNYKNIKWGQYTPSIREKDLRILLRMARRKGWKIF